MAMKDIGAVNKEKGESLGTLASSVVSQNAALLFTLANMLLYFGVFSLSIFSLFSFALTSLLLRVLFLPSILLTRVLRLCRAPS